MPQDARLSSPGALVKLPSLEPPPTTNGTGILGGTLHLRVWVPLAEGAGP